MTASADWALWSTRARVVVTEPAALPRARALTDRVVRHVDLAANRFRADSEIRTLRPDATGDIRLTPVLADLLGLAIRAARRTGGAVDPTVGAALADLGYDRDIRLITPVDPRAARPVAVLRPVPGWRALDLRDGVLRMPAGLQLDLGALAKAYAADLAADLVATRLGTGVLVSLGGDLATAGPAPDGDWQVVVQDAPDQPASHLAIGSRTAVATSSTLHRAWRRGDAQLHHIVDPATGRSADRAWRTVTVVAPTCVEANTLSTATVVKAGAGLAWLTARGRPARLVAADGTVHRLGGYPAEAPGVAA